MVIQCVCIMYTALVRDVHVGFYSYENIRLNKLTLSGDGSTMIIYGIYLY